MPLMSMTGFARAQAQLGAGSAIIEAKSVNGRALDIKLRLPSGFDRLDQPLRQLVQARFKRGSVSLGIALQATQGGAPVFNPAFLAELAALRASLSSVMPLAPSTLEGLMALRGAMSDNAAGSDEAADDAAILAEARNALDSLVAMRRSEGAGIESVIRSQLERIHSLADLAAADPSLTQESIIARLASQLALLGQAVPDLDRQRLHAEAALLATKADIREEIDRLLIHVASIRALLASQEPQGRKLDFLAQELNREANTLCSKANAASLTAIGLDLKVVIDQFREQVQNVE
jgi:uncharacterized protein (TIGR00255 family)